MNVAARLLLALFVLACGLAAQPAFAAAPAVTAISPTAGPLAGGTTVTITGTGLTGATAVDFGANAATSFTVVGDTQVTAVVPAGTGTVDVTATTSGGTSAIVAADHFTYDAPPTVTGISPTSGSFAGGIPVVITGTNFTNGAAVVFGTAAASSVTVNSATQITATAPGVSIGSIGPVDIQVTTPGGTSATSAADSFTYTSVPGVTAVSPAGGASTGGTPVTITGAGFTGATNVLFGGTPATNPTVVSDTEITALSPGGASTVDVQVVTPNGTSAKVPADHFTFVLPPIVTSISPVTGPAAGGTSVVINGSRFTGATAVMFGTTSATSFTVNSATKITAITALSTAGVVDVTVAVQGAISATSAADQFTYVGAPTITAVSPAGGPPTGGNTVTLTGTDFGGATSVKFGTVAAKSLFISSNTEITAVAPAGKLGSTVDITVTTPDGTSTVNPKDQYTYTTVPTVTAVSPATGSTSGGTPVTITGTNLTGATGVSFGSNAAATFAVVSATQVTATAPASTAAGTVDVVVTTLGGPSATSAADHFTYTTPVASGGVVYSYQSTLGVAGVAKADNTHFSSPSGSTVDTGNNHLFVADTANHRVQIYDTGTLAVVGTIGTAGVAGTDNTHLNAPQGVGFDAATGHILVADSGNHRIQIFNATSFAYVSTLGTTGVPASDNTHFNTPVGVHLNAAARQLYIADSVNDRIQVYDADALTRIATIGTSGAVGTDNAHFNTPKDAEFNPSANQIMVADSGNSRLQLFNAATFAYVSTIGAQPLGAADNDFLGIPVTATFDPASNLVLVADAGADSRVQVFDAMTYNYVLTLGTTASVGTKNTQFSAPFGIAVDTGHSKLFISDQRNDRVQVFSIASPVTFASVLPGSRSVLLGKPATIFASVVNAGTAALNNCQIALPVTSPAGLSLTYQTTNSTTNALTGTVNTPATIAGNNGVQSFLVTFQGKTAFSATDLPLDFDCLGAGPAAIETGVDTVDLTFSSTAIADIIALSATPTNDGIAQIPSSGNGVFAVASTNVGVSSSIIVAVDTGAATLPVTPTICQSNPSTGVCLSAAASSVTVNFTAGSTPTFSVFLASSGPIALDPANSRLFVRFKDASGTLHGSTSVAVETQ